jgi:glycosyltransferase involved in cell wall biosynthesis
MYRAVLAKASSLIFVSEFSRREFERLVGLPRSAYIAHNAVDEGWFSPTIQPQSSIEGDYVVFVGNVKPHKNLSGLLEAMVAVREQADVSLVIVGKLDGFITGDAKGAAQARDLSQWVRVVEGASDDELKSIVAGARAMAFPSFYEGFGLPPLEAMAAGCPTAVSNAASIPEICADSSAYFDPRDPSDMARAIVEVLHDPELTAALVAKGKDRARQFSWRTTAGIVAHAVEQAVAQ